MGSDRRARNSKYSDSKVEEVCRENGVRYHHHDEFDEPRYGPDKDLRKAIVVVYSSAFGPWQLAINEDGTFARPGDDFLRQVESLQARIRARL